MKNLIRVQGYLATLSAEIDDPEKLGPGTSRAEWKRLTHELSSRLSELEKIFIQSLKDAEDE